jgi:hypothetical protein
MKAHLSLLFRRRHFTELDRLQASGAFNCDVPLPRLNQAGHEGRRLDRFLSYAQSQSGLFQRSVLFAIVDRSVFEFFPAVSAGHRASFGAASAQAARATD